MFLATIHRFINVNMLSGQAKILLIDFNESFAKSLSAYLCEVGFDVQVCLSEKALDKQLESIQWRQVPNPGQPDLVISELALGGRCGIQLLTQIKAQAPFTPVVLASADGSVRDVVDALRKGVDDYILKPLDDLSVVARVLEKALRHGRLELQHARAQEDLKHLNKELKRSMAALERDQTAGRSVQQQFLPPTPVKLGELDISFDIIPSLYLSGDSIDYGYIGGRYLAFYLTDVSGHGSASAFVTVWVKQLVRGMFRDQSLFHSPESFEKDIPKLMETLNEELLKANIGPHLTCLVGVIDTQNLDLNYVVGGHLPLPILMQDGTVEYLQGKGKPLGLFEGAKWQVNSQKLQDEFTLVVFSDGVLELFDSKDLGEKENQLAAKIQEAKPAQISALKEGLPLQNRDTVPDDVAMLLIQRKRVED